MKKPDLYRSYRRSQLEAIVILIAWAGFCLWVVGSCAVGSYRQSADELTLVWGLPGWVFWSIAVPWMAANLFTAWFCFGFLQDEPNEEEDHA